MPTALFSLSNKAGMQEFGRKLVALGWRLLASGGTADALAHEGIPVTQITDVTGVPEFLGGRVKTLHPKIFGGILARDTDADRHDLEHLGASMIDMVVVNLYPFQQVSTRKDASLEEAVENIDIGGAALIRAAAKNYQRTTVIINPEDYPDVLAELEASGEVGLESRRRLAARAFAHTAAYDKAIQNYFETNVVNGGEAHHPIQLTLHPILPLRYGENPHQEAVLYGYQASSGPLGGELLQGKTLSYNNLLDLDAAWRAVVSFATPTIVIVKHLSPCGIATAEPLAQAFTRALASDPVSAFGSVIATNRELDGATANAIGDLFVECIAAPGFSASAVSVLQERKNLRLLRIPLLEIDPPYEYRSVNGGLLRQTIDRGDPTGGGFTSGSQWEVVSRRQPTELEESDLTFAWLACQHVKSNAIVFARDGATVGIGGGQPNRVDCVRLAAGRAGEKAQGAVMASDAFFPFPDSIEEAAKARISAVIQPGGSVRDQEVVAAADRHNMAMVLTGTRHFRH